MIESLERAREHHSAGRLDEAAKLCRDILREDAGNPDALHRLGLIVRDRGQKEKALELLRRASRLMPDSAEIHSDLGKTLAGYRDFGAAIQRFECALAIDPARVDDYPLLAAAYGEVGRSDRVLETCERAMKFADDDPRISGRIATAMMMQGRMTDALEIWRRIVASGADAASHSGLLFCMHYVPDQAPLEIFEEHRQFADAYETPLLAQHLAHANDRDPHRKLRIGYVSPDFKNHPVGQFLEPVLARHDRDQFEIFCYSATSSFDKRTMSFQKIAGERWRDMRPLNPDQSAALVRRDSIDILVDLAGHTAGNQLMLFARKPAPVQVTWLGYPDTTGLRSIDYRITDANADPPGASDHLHSEQLLRLPCFLCYEPPEDIPDVSELPALKNGFTTFGSFNNFLKVAPQTIETWAEILREVPGSKLMLKHRGGADIGAKEMFPRYFEKYGIASDRILIVPPTPSHRQHLTCFHDIDIALDPFPYNGTTTSCETLAMGVPIVALEGSSHVSRVSVSLLRQVGLDDWIARSRSEYVRIAVERSSSLTALEQLRKDLRGRLLDSDLGNPAGFVRHLERAYRNIWVKFCSE